MMSETNLNNDPEMDAELLDALSAAFGDDAQSILAESVSDAEAGFDSEQDLHVDQTETPVGESHSPLVRFTHELTRKIYAGDFENSIPDAESRCLACSVGSNSFGIPIGSVVEILNYPKVTSLPRTPNWLRGVTNFRGQILSVTDLRNLLRLSGCAPIVGEKIVVVKSEQHDKKTAVVVDSVEGIRQFGLVDTPIDVANPSFEQVAQNGAFVDQQDTPLLSVEKLFELADLSASV